MPDAPLRLALGLRSTVQSLGRIAIETGLFAEAGVEVQIAAMETAAPVAVAGLIDGTFDVAEVGAVPIVEAVAQGHDLVILLAPEEVNALFVVGRRDIDVPESLKEGRLGVLSLEGQTGVSARAMLARWGIEDHVDLAPLGSYPAIYRAIAGGEIEAGLLSADWRFAGATGHGMTALADLGEEFGFQGSVVATTSRLVSGTPDRVRALVRGYVDAIRLFKSDRARVLPILADHLGFDDPDAVAAAYEFYVPRFRVPPLPSIVAIGQVIELFGAEGRAITAQDVCNTSFLDGLAANGASQPH